MRIVTGEVKEAAITGLLKQGTVLVETEEYSNLLASSVPYRRCRGEGPTRGDRPSVSSRTAESLLSSKTEK